MALPSIAISKFYLISNSISTSRLLLSNITHIGGTAATLQSLFIELYNHPLFSIESQKVEDETSLELDLNLYKLKRQLSTGNYFKQSLDKRGIRQLMIHTLNEFNLSGLNINDEQIQSIKLANVVKGEGFKELITLWQKTERTFFTYPLILQELLVRVDAGYYDSILSDMTIFKPTKFIIPFIGIEKELLEKIVAKTRSEAIQDYAEYISAPTSSTLGALQDYLSQRLDGKTPQTNSRKLDTTVSIKSNATKTALIQNVLQWMYDTKASSADTVIGVFEYDQFAASIFTIANELKLPIYLSKGLLVSNFSFFEDLMVRFNQLDTMDENFEKRVKDMFSPRKEDTLLVSSFKLRCISHFIKLVKYNDSLEDEDTIDIRDMLIQHATKIRITSAELALQPGGLTLFSVEELDHIPLKNTVILGLENSNYPFKTRIDPLLDTETRHELNKSAGLSFTIDEKDPRSRLVERIIINTSSNVFLGFSSHSLETGKLNIPSGLYNQILDFIGQEPSLENIHKLAGTGNGPLTDIVPDNKFVDFSQVDVLGSKIDLYQKDYFSNTENHLDTALCDTLPEKLSATSIKRFFDCPYQFYLRDIKKIYKPELVSEEDVTFWLDALDRGSFLHEIYEYLLEPFTQQDNKTIEDYREYLDNCTVIPAFNLALESFSEKGTNAPDWIKQRELIEIKETAQQFLNHEVENASIGSFFPIGTEEDFKEHSVTLSHNGVSFPLIGQADRINTDGKGNWQIIDYKTGGDYLVGVKENLLTNTYGSINIQHALYSLIIEKLDLYDKSVFNSLEAGYYYATDRGNWKTYLAKDKVYTPAFNTIKEFLFDELAKKSYSKCSASCKYCDYNSFCQPRPFVADQIIRINDVVEAL